MKSINEENYESWLLDYSEGNLSAKQKALVDTFLSARSDLALLVSGLDEIKLTPQHIPLPNKQALYKKTGGGQLKYLWLPLSAAAALALFYILPSNINTASYQPRNQFTEQNQTQEKELNPFLAFVKEEVIELAHPTKESKEITNENLRPNSTLVQISPRNAKEIEPVNNQNSLVVVPSLAEQKLPVQAEEIEYPSVKNALIKRIAKKLKLQEDENVNNLAFELGSKTLENISNGKWKINKFNNADGTKSIAFTAAKLEIKRTTKINL